MLLCLLFDYIHARTHTLHIPHKNGTTNRTLFLFTFFRFLWDFFCFAIDKTSCSHFLFRIFVFPFHFYRPWAIYSACFPAIVFMCALCSIFGTLKVSVNFWCLWKKTTTATIVVNYTKCSSVLVYRINAKRFVLAPLLIYA